MRTVVLGLVAAVAVWPSRASADDPPAKLDFDPGLKLKWPGKPSERGTASSDGSKHYFASYAHKEAGRTVIFSAFVKEHTEDDLKKSSIEELMRAFVFALKKDEVSRKEIEHGLDKLPGLDIVTRRVVRMKDAVSRKVVVAAGRRLYEVSVTTGGTEVPDTPEIKAFIESLSVRK